MARAASPEGEGAKTNRRVWDDALFDQLSKIGDPVADGVIEAHVATAPAITPREFVATMARHVRLPPEHQSAPIQHYLAETPPLPPWTDDDQLRRGANFFAENGIGIGLALFCASLPEAYAGARGAAC